MGKLNPEYYDKKGKMYGLLKRKRIHRRLNTVRQMDEREGRKEWIMRRDRE